MIKQTDAYQPAFLLDQNLDNSFQDYACFLAILSKKD